jgi:hypothetical protein
MKTKARIESVRIERVVDTNPDTSSLGKYGNTATSPAAVDREERGDCGRHEYRYFNPTMTGKETGNSKSPEQDYQRMESLNRGEWCYLGIIAKAVIVSAGGIIQTIRSGGLWGIESDSDAGYFAEVERDELAQLKAELLSLGFGERAIAHAFKNV